MEKRLLTAALTLLLCLTLLPAAAWADDPVIELSTPPRIKEVELCISGGETWVEVVIKTPSSVRSLINMLATFEMEQALSGIQMNVCIGDAPGQILEMTFIGDGDKWSGRWRSESLSGYVQGEAIQAQIRYCGYDDKGGFICSQWSDMETVAEGEGEKEEPFEFIAHDWAKPELTEADGLGLIPAGLRTADLTQPITRAEFAAVSVKVYEALSGLTTEPAAENPFTDTTDPEVLKALHVGITNGLSATEFAPDKLLNREQAATMLSRVYKKVAFEGWTLGTDGDFAEAFRALFTMPEPFADDADISSWARDSVYFMAANGILKGMEGGIFQPRAVTEEQQAAGYAQATREQAILIAVRLVKNLGT